MTSFTTNNTTPASTTKESNLREPLVATIDSGPVQAYAKLEGDDFCYYIRTLQVSLGRKVNSPENVDIPLGNTKSVSRQHARLFYNFTMQRFELMVFGKNGAFVNEQFIERGVTVPLENKTKIQIGEMAFVFLLPKPDADTVNTNNNASPHNHDNNFGYISTPQQLEKNITKTTTSPPIQPSLLEDDFEMSEEPNPYSNKNTKPPYSYASLIAQAINSCKEGRMTLNGIYNYITTNYPYYQMAQNGWQNSIRHNLSLNKAFIKVPRGETEPPGKGAFWTIDDSAITQFTDGVYKNKRTGSNIPPAEHTKKKIKKDIKANSSDHSEEEEEDELIEEEEPDIKKEEEKEQDINKGKIKQDITLNVNKEITVIEKKTVANIPKVKEEIITSSETTTNSNNNTQEAQAQLQAQLQNTIRQHLLDPVRYPLPPSIAQLLPHAIAQLPPQLATQLSSTLQTNINVVGNEFSNNNHLPETTTVNDDKIIKADDPPIK